MVLYDKVRELDGSVRMTVVHLDGNKVICEWAHQGTKMQKEFLVEQLTPWIKRRVNWQVAV